MAIQSNDTVIEKFEPLVVDINDNGLMEGATYEFDLKEDWQAKASPPPANKYRLMLTLEDTKVDLGLKQGFSKTDPNGFYYRVQVICKIQAEGSPWNNSVVFYNASSTVPRGKKLSSMAGLMIMMGAKLPAKMSELAVTKAFVQLVNKHNPVLIADCDWSTWDMEAESKGDFGALFLKGMKNFPKKADGTHEHIVRTKKGKELIAKLKVEKWLGKSGAVAPAAAPVAPVKPVAPKPAPVPVAEATSIADDLFGGGVSTDADDELILEG